MRRSLRNYTLCLAPENAEIKLNVNNGFQHTEDKPSSRLIRRQLVSSWSRSFSRAPDFGPGLRGVSSALVNALEWGLVESCLLLEGVVQTRRSVKASEPGTGIGALALLRGFLRERLCEVLRLRCSFSFT